MTDSTEQEEIRSTIDHSPLFKHLSEAWRSRLADNSKLETYTAGEKVIDEGQEEQHHLYIILEGRARVWTQSPDEEVELKTLKPGGYFGEVSLLSEKVATATVEPKDDELVVLELQRKTLLELIEQDEKVREMLEGITLARAKDTIGKVMK